MKRTSILGTAALLAAGMIPALAQAPTVGGDIQVWYTQMMDSNLRNNSAAPGGYYNLRGEFKENTFAIRRAEIKLSGKITDEVGYEVMFDPSINTTAADSTKPSASYNPTILQDAFITWKPGNGFELKAGEFKTLQTYEGNISSTELLFAERSQLGRVFGDKRDRGVILMQGFGDPKDFAGKVSVGVLNGMSDLASGKASDNNAQKDFIARLDFTFETAHKFGVYTLQGGTDQQDKGKLLPTSFAGGANAPLPADVLDNKDKTTNLGAFYVFQNDTWHASFEYINGLLGRRFPSVTTDSTLTSAKREHMDQKFMGYYLTGGYTTGNHSIVLRYDMLNYNSGDQWYTAYDPYTMKDATTSLGADYSPKYTETTLGYIYAWKPEKVKAANLKLNYIMRSKNFLKPMGTQTGEQGGDTFVAAFQVAF